MSAHEVEEYDAPAHWASALINGDDSGLDEAVGEDGQVGEELSKASKVYGSVDLMAHDGKVFA